MKNGNDELLGNARNMDRDVEYKNNQKANRKNSEPSTGDPEAIDPAGLSGGDTRGR
ncbi:hypothetical protein [Bacillus sp. T33-2]|uniref:hypothetical protein n=1 Tax=Bacillus sp. T33-2 TaxID=2054168 RepID=UPI0015E0FF76|nr:hypothetical protein [Bacillus sp. T33-2]